MAAIECGVLGPAAGGVLDRSFILGTRDVGSYSVYTLAPSYQLVSGGSHRQEVPAAGDRCECADTDSIHGVTSRVQGAAIDIRGPHKRTVLIRLKAAGPERWLLEGEEAGL